VLSRNPRPLVIPPAADETWLRQFRDAWVNFWRSDLASLVQPLDEVAARRLYALYDERERAWRAYRKRRFIAGSQRQPRLNPLGSFALQLDAQIGRVEKAFGIGPRSRAQLGLAIGGLKKTLDDLNDELHDEPGADEDPRIRFGGSPQ